MVTNLDTFKKIILCCTLLFFHHIGYAQLADDCAGAVTVLYNLNVAGDYTNQTLNIPAGQTASATPPTCSPGLATIQQDSWFRIRANATGLLVVSFTPSTAQDIALAVYGNNCATLPLLQCANRFTGPFPTFVATASKNTESAVISAVSGTDYLVRVMNLSSTGAYTGNVSIYPGPLSQRDLCWNSVPISIGTCNFGFDVSANHVHNESLTAPISCPGATTVMQDSWARLTLTAGTRIRVRYTNTNKNAAIAMYSGDCGNLVQEACRNAVTGVGTEDMEFQAATTATYYLRVMNLTDNSTMTGNICIDEVYYRDDAADVLSGTFPSPIKVGSCGVRVVINSTLGGGNAADPTSCNGSQNNIWLKYVAPAADNGKYLRAEFAGDGGVGIAVVTAGWTDLSPASCVTSSASSFAATNFTVVGGTTYYFELTSGDNSVTVTGALCLYEDITRSEDYFYTSRTFQTNGADCGKIFNLYNTFDDDGGFPITTNVGGVGNAINTPSCTSPISRNDAWGNFQVASIPAGGYIVEYNNDDNNSNTTASNVSLQIFRGGVIQTAGTVSNGTFALACAGTAINTNSVVTGISVNTANDGSSLAPTCLTNTINRDVWVRYTSTGTGNFRVVFRNSGVETGGQGFLVQVYTATGTCGTPTLTQVGCGRKGGVTPDENAHPDVATALITNTASGIDYYIRIVTTNTTDTGYTITGELSVNDPNSTQLVPIACSAVVTEGTESITLNTGSPAAFVTGRQYYFRVGVVESGPRTVQGTVCIRNNAIPAGDLCSNAVQLIVGDCDINFNLTSAFTNNQNLTDATATTAPLPPSNCALPAANAWRDGWVSFTATSTVTAIEYIQQNSTTEDAQIEIFRGTCGSLTRVAALGTSNFCVNSVPVSTAGEERYQFSSIAGVVYFARIINRFANTMTGKLCIYNVTERDICDDDDLDTRFVGDCNLFVDVPLTFDNDVHPNALDPNFKDFNVALPVTETGGSLPQQVTSSCEVPFSTSANGNPANTNVRDAWVRFVGNGNDVTLIYQTTGTNSPNPAIAVYTALKSVGPVNCGTGLSGANNPDNQYACANNVTAPGQQTESVTFKTNAGQQYLLRIMNLDGNVGMTGILCISDGRNNYASPCETSSNPPRRVEIGKCSVPLNVVGRTTPNCFDPTDTNNAYNNTGVGQTCDDCISGESWAIVTRPYICNPALTPPSPNTFFDGVTTHISCNYPYRVNLGADGVIGGAVGSVNEDKCECGQSSTNTCGTGTPPNPVFYNSSTGVCPQPYSYDNNKTNGTTADDRCVCSQQTIRPGTTSSSFTISYDNRNGTSTVAPNVNMLVYTTTNCNDEDNYTRIACVSTPTGEGIRSHTITGLTSTHTNQGNGRNGGETYLIRILNQSNTGQTLFGSLCLFYGSSLGGGPDCPVTSNNDYGDLEGDFANFNVDHDGSAPPTGESSPTTTIAGCVVPGGSNPSSNGTNPIRSDAWMKFVVPANVTYSKVTVQYDNSGYSTTRNAAIAVYTAPTHPQGADGIGVEPNCNTYDATTNPDGLFLLDCVNTVFSGSESVTVPITFSGGVQPSTTPTSVARTYYVRVMNVHNEDDPGTLNGRIRIFPYADCNLGSELAYDGDFERWPAVTYTAGFPNNQTETTASFDTKMNAAVFSVPQLTNNDPYPNDIDGVFGGTVNTGVAQYATDYGFVRDGEIPTGTTVPVPSAAERPFKHSYAESISAGNQYELGPEGLYLIRQTPFSVHQAFICYGAGYSGYGNSGHTTSSDGYCGTGGAGNGNEPCQSISLGSSGYNTIGAYRLTNGLGAGRPAAVPSASDANFMIVNGSYNPSGTLPPGKIWCQTIQRDVNDWSDVSYYVFSIWSQNLIQAGWNLDLPQLRLTVCDMENPADGTLPTIRDMYSSGNGDVNENETRMSRLPGITDTGLVPSLYNASSNPKGLFEEELSIASSVKQQVRHLPRPGNNRIFALVNSGTRPPSYGAAMTCNLSQNNGWTGGENVNEALNARVKVLGSSFLVPEAPDNWFAIRCIYRAPRNVREMNICIENLSLTQNGNDLAVDKISFRKCEGADAEVFDKLLKGDPCELSNDGKNIGIPLPARLIEFSGNLLGDRVVLNWLTIGELEAETSHYQIQRSVDGNHFTPIGAVDAKGLSNNYAQYAYTDVNLPQGVKTVYYRLNIVDKRGLEHLGSIVVVNIEGQSNFGLKLVPNPTEKGNIVNLMFHSGLAGKALVEVTDLMGTRLMSQTNQANTGDNTISVSTQGLKSGLYLVRLVLNGKVATQKLVVR